VLYVGLPIMAGNFPNLSTYTISRWPDESHDPVTRGWYPPYAITFAAFASAVLVARLVSQVKKSASGIRADDMLVCVAWVRDLYIYRDHFVDSDIGVCNTVHSLNRLR
jgi:hypothetical protein